MLVSISVEYLGAGSTQRVDIHYVIFHLKQSTVLINKFCWQTDEMVHISTA
jgi:hypothetical protein